MRRIRIIEDKSKNYKGNHDQQMVCFDTANSLFVAQSQMTYASFRAFARRLAEYFDANEMVISDEDNTQYLITVYEYTSPETNEYCYKFWHTPEDAKSVADRIYYSKEDFQKTQELKGKLKQCQ